MIYLLYGDDTYRSWQKLRQIKAKYLDASMGDTDLATLDGSTLQTVDFQSQTQLLPFLAKSRLVVVRNLLLEGKKEVQEGVAAVLTSIPKTSVVFFYEAGSPDKRTKLFQALNQPKSAQLFTRLDDGQLIAQIKRMAAEQSVELAGPALQLFIRLVGADLWRVEQELQKAALYKLGAKSNNLTEAEIKLLVGGEESFTIFELTDAFGLRRGRRAAELLRRLPPDESGLGLLAMVAGHFRNLLLVAEGLRQNLAKSELPKVLKLHPFVVDKTRQQLASYQAGEVRSVYRYLLQLDLAAKQSLVEPLAGLSVLAASLEQRPLKLPSLTEETVL